MDRVRNSCSPSGSRKNRSSRITPRNASAAERAIERTKGAIGERHCAYTLYARKIALRGDFFSFTTSHYHMQLCVEEQFCAISQYY